MVKFKLSLQKAGKLALLAEKVCPEGYYYHNYYLLLRGQLQREEISEEKFKNLRSSLFKEMEEKEIPQLHQVGKKKRTKKQAGYRCQCCGARRATVVRPMILRKIFGHTTPVKVCPECDKSHTDLQILFSYLPMKKWSLAKRVLYSGTLITKENENFIQPVGLWEIGGRVSWKRFKEGFTSYKASWQVEERKAELKSGGRIEAYI